MQWAAVPPTALTIVNHRPLALLSSGARGIRGDSKQYKSTLKNHQVQAYFPRFQTDKATDSCLYSSILLGNLPWHLHKLCSGDSVLHTSHWTDIIHPIKKIKRLFYIIKPRPPTASTTSDGPSCESRKLKIPETLREAKAWAPGTLAGSAFLMNILTS